MILNDPQGLTEPLEVDDLPLTKEADRIADLGILYQTENVVVGLAGLLFRRHGFVKVGDGIAGGLEFCCREWSTACCLRPDPGGVIHIIRSEALFLQLFGGETAGELMDDGGYDLHMSQLLGSDIGEHRFALFIGHGIALGKVTHGGTGFSVRAAVSRYQRKPEKPLFYAGSRTFLLGSDNNVKAQCLCLGVIDDPVK